MTRYICDRCGKELKHVEDPKGGAHRLKISDVIPWIENHELAKYQKDLCGSCNKDLREFLRPAPEAM